MQEELKTPEELLRSKNITPETKHHSYDYIYKTVVELMKKDRIDTIDIVVKKCAEEAIAKEDPADYGTGDIWVDKDSILQVADKLKAQLNE